LWMTSSQNQKSKIAFQEKVQNSSIRGARARATARAMRKISTEIYPDPLREAILNFFISS